MKKTNFYFFITWLYTFKLFKLRIFFQMFFVFENNSTFKFERFLKEIHIFVIIYSNIFDNSFIMNICALILKYEFDIDVFEKKRFIIISLTPTAPRSSEKNKGFWTYFLLNQALHVFIFTARCRWLKCADRTHVFVWKLSWVNHIYYWLPLHMMSTCPRCIQSFLSLLEHEYLSSLNIFFNWFAAWLI